jgi:hypothetical protein
MGLKKNKIINIRLQSNDKTCCYGVTTVRNVDVCGDLWGGIEAIKDFMIHDSEFSFGMDLIQKDFPGNL